MSFWPTTFMPTAKATRTNASQPKMAFLRCCPLQRAIRAATLWGGGGGSGGEPFPELSGCTGCGSPWMMRVFIAVPLGGLDSSNLASAVAGRQAGNMLFGGRFSGVFAPGAALAAQEQQHREHAPRLACGRGEPELAEDARDVLLHCAERYHELVGDSLVGAAGRHELEHLALAGRQLDERVVTSPLRQQCRNDDRIDRRAAAGNTFDGGD